MKINAFKQSFRSLTNTHIPKEEMGEFLSNLTVKNYAEFELDTKGANWPFSATHHHQLLCFESLLDSQ